MREEKRIDESLETSLNEFKSIHPQFFEKLNELSEGRLTPLDQRYCGYLYLNLSTKEIATIFSVEPKSVRMTKYRIKQKLNLVGEQSLEEFLRGLEG
ncbi:helix-turn-helix transcriptional regulator [Ornithobacterium rhinotracheale]|uniref:helix-turn-helix transcriptional regulator n=1 Tax=Ornithobacterium rhinotracheale TaxID=28251 RepID=UPI003873B7D6